MRFEQHTVKVGRILLSSSLHSYYFFANGKGHFKFGDRYMKFRTLNSLAPRSVRVIVKFAFVTHVGSTMENKGLFRGPPNRHHLVGVHGSLKIAFPIVFAIHKCIMQFILYMHLRCRHTMQTMHLFKFNCKKQNFVEVVR